jgi:hypothetical protein
MVSIDSLVQTWMASGRDGEIVETVSGTLNTYKKMVNQALNFDNDRYLEWPNLFDKGCSGSGGISYIGGERDSSEG